MENREQAREQPLIMSALAGTAIAFDREHLPDRLKLFHWGANPTDEGDIVVDETSVAALNKQIAQDTFRRIVLDFEHQSLKGHPNFKPAPRHNAAHGDLEVVPGEGVYISALAWTPKGVEHGADYCDLSPVAVHTKRKAKGEPATLLGVLSAALCDNGRVRGISAFSASYNPTENIMEDQQKAEIAALQATIKTQGEQLAALSARLDDIQPKVEAATGVTAASLNQVMSIADAAVKPEALDEGRQQISALSARLDAIQKEHMIQIAVLQGKAVTLDDAAVSAMSADSLAQHISGLGVTLPVVRRTPAGQPVETRTSGLAARQNELVARIARETGCADFQINWAEASRRDPELFKI